VGSAVPRLQGALRGLGLAAVGFNVDTGHAVLHGMRPEEAIRFVRGLLG